MLGTFWSLYQCESQCEQRFLAEIEITAFDESEAFCCPQCGGNEIKFIRDIDELPI